MYGEADEKKETTNPRRGLAPLERNANSSRLSDGGLMHRTKYKHGAERTAKAKESLEGSRASFDHIALSGLPFAL